MFFGTTIFFLLLLIALVLWSRHDNSRKDWQSRVQGQMNATRGKWKGKREAEDLDSLFNLHARTASERNAR